MTAADLLWPRCRGPEDLAAIEAVPLAERGLPETTYDALRRAAGLWPGRPAVTVLPDAQNWQRPSERTFAELLCDVHRAANVLHDLGVRRHDAVALMSPNCEELITATLAAQLAGIAVPINAGLSSDHVTDVLARSGARVLIANGPELGQTETLRELLAGGRLDAVLLLRPTRADAGPPPAEAPDGAVKGYLRDLAADQDAGAFLGTPPSADDLAALFHTGGTTGTPKLAAHSHRNEVADAWAIAANDILDENVVILAALPLFHVNALVVTLLAPLLRGQQVVWAGPLGYRDPHLYEVFWKLVERFRVAAMSAVPTVYAALAACPVDADISTLRIAMVGASPLPPAVREAFERHTGVLLVEGYGLTEGTCATARGFRGEPRAGTVGQRLPYQRLKTVAVREDGTWEDLPAGALGVLAISGPNVFPGYATGRDAAGRLELDGLGSLRDGWLSTGDLARVDDDGFVHLAGRAKDLIIRGGHNIDPAQIEDVLLSHPDVTGAGAVGQPDIHAGEVPVAYVTLRPGAGTDGEALRAWAAERSAEPAAAPKRVEVVDALPVTDIGKPYKPPLRADAARHAVAAAVGTVAGVRGVAAAAQGGAVEVTVQTAPGYDEAAVRAVMDRFSLAWRAEAAP